MTKLSHHLPPPLLLCVLAGGRSRRFKSSKLRLRLDGQPILAHIAQRMQPLRPVARWLSVAPSALLCPPPACGAYERLIPDPLPYAGPLPAMAHVLQVVLRACHCSAAPLVAFLAADMPHVCPTYVLQLARRLSRQPGRTAIMGRWIQGPGHGRIEPFPCIWRPDPGACLARHASQTTHRSLQRFAMRAGVAALPLAHPKDQPHFLNINRPKDLERLSMQTPLADPS